jgi:beta-1,4-mannosyl-glycoprotein beta-1,4-N-acetylglucosaminyltransferase
MIIDAFIFFNELELLELRLGQLEDVVDKFVFAEANTTFTGQAKPYHFTDNRARFAQWEHKIVFAPINLSQGDGWSRERQSRELLGRAIIGLNLNPNTTLSFSDLDEIPNPETLRAYTPDLGLRNLKQYTYYYNFNRLMDYGNRAWSRARVGTVSDISRRGGMQDFRGGIGDMDPNFPSIENGGWHGSYFGSLARIRHKVNSFAHNDMAPVLNELSDGELASRVANGKDLFGRDGISSGTWVDTDVSQDHRLPPYFLANREKFKAFTEADFREKNQGVL